MKKFLSIVLCVLAVSLTYSCCGEKALAHESKVIAHRGYWKAEGSAQNSLASLRKAAEAGCYGSEFDVHLTADGVLIVNHDNDWEGQVIQDTPYSAFEEVRLSNGEKMPTLREYLQEGAKHPDLKLILEIKSARTPEHESRSVKEIMDMVDETGVRDQIEYISFSYHICREILSREPQAPVAYLNGDKSIEELVADGIPGFDYNIKKVRQNTEIFEQARNAGVYSNVWTVNKEEDLRFVIENKVDFITTDEPELAMALITEARQE